MATTEAQNIGIRAFAATNPTADALAAAKKQYNVTDEDYAYATAPNPYDGWNAHNGTNLGIDGKDRGYTPDQLAAGQAEAAASPSMVVGGSTGNAASSLGSLPVLKSNGIIGTAAQPAATTTQPVNTYTAAKTTADTVEGRMANLVDQNNPLNQAVATAARGSANQRGLLNSSIGESMVQDGIIKNALSIASPDAAATNTANQFNANATNQAGQFNASAQNASNLLNQANAYDSIKTATNQANTVTNANTTIDANRLTTASSAVTSIMNNTTAYISSIDRTLSGEAQQALKDGYNTQAKVSLQIIGSLAGDVNLSRYIDSLFTV